jgi:hypothetical protein
MLCKQCREQIEQGEACVAEGYNGHTRYYHVGCHLRMKEDQKAEDEAFEEIERQAHQARMVN